MPINNKYSFNSLYLVDDNLLFFFFWGGGGKKIKYVSNEGRIYSDL